MAVDNPSGIKTFTAAGTIAAYERVVIDATAGTVTRAAAGASGDYQGVALENAASGDDVPVKMKNSSGTFKGVAAGAIVKMAPVYGAANGRIDDASSGSVIGTALDAATNAGDIIEWMPI